MEVIIREVQLGDYEEILRFFNENNIPSIIRQFNPFPLNKKTAYNIASSNLFDHYYVAFFKDQMVGLCMLRGLEEGYSVPSFGILIDQRFQNCGIGKKMAKFSLEEARRLSCNQVRLSVYASNKAALHLYASLGFIEIKRKSVMVMGESDEKVIMFKDLLTEI